MQGSITYKDRRELVKAVMRKKKDSPRGILGLKLTTNVLVTNHFWMDLGRRSHPWIWRGSAGSSPVSVTRRCWLNAGSRSPCTPRNRRAKLVRTLPFLLNTCALRFLQANGETSGLLLFQAHFPGQNHPGARVHGFQSQTHHDRTR